MARIPRKMINTKNCRQNTDKSSVKVHKKYANLAVTFTKRRLTTYRRASELSTLTGADVAIITFSSSPSSNSDRACCFGSPDVHSVIDRYLKNHNCRSAGGGDKLPVVNNPESIQSTNSMNDLREKWNLLEREYEYQQERGRVMDRMMEERKEYYWWDSPIENLNLGKLEELKTKLQNIVGQIDFLVN